MPVRWCFDVNAINNMIIVSKMRMVNMVRPRIKPRIKTGRIKTGVLLRISVSTLSEVILKLGIQESSAKEPVGLGQ